MASHEQDNDLIQETLISASWLPWPSSCRLPKPSGTRDKLYVEKSESERKESACYNSSRSDQKPVV